MRNATHLTASAFALLAAYAGVEHGIGEVRQGFAAPGSVFIQSWPDTHAFEALGGEPAMTLVPSLALTGLLAILVSVAIAVWAARFLDRRRGATTLLALSLLLLLVGGGMFPPLIGVLGAFTATRIARHPAAQPGNGTRVLARAWPGALIACVLGYLALVPGVVLLTASTGFDSSPAVTALIVFAFAALVLSFLSARARDHVHEASLASRPAERHSEVQP